MNLDTTLNYLREHGDFIQRARLEAWLEGTAASAQVVEAALGGQRADGGYRAGWSGGRSSLEATCGRLALAEGLGLSARQARVASALDFLRQRQGLEGCFEEHPGLREVAPPRVRPGSLAARLYLTAHCGFWLAVYGLDEARAALHFLRDHLDAARRLPSLEASHWLACGLALRLGDTGFAEVLADHLRARLEHLPAHDLAPMLVALRLGGIFGGHPLWLEGRARLAALRGPDGSWAGPGGPDAGVTLEALRALASAGRGAKRPQPGRTPYAPDTRFG